MIIGIIDVETTSIKPEEGEVIEVALIVTNPNGDRLDSYHSFQDVYFELSSETQRITKITNQLIKNSQINHIKLRDMFDSCDLMIAHNAKFDRAWVEEKFNLYNVKDGWGCSYEMIYWDDWGMECKKLRHLCLEHDIVPVSHRAISDVDSLHKLLFSGPWDRIVNDEETSPFECSNYMHQLLRNREKNWCIVFSNSSERPGNNWKWSGKDNKTKYKKKWWSIQDFNYIEDGVDDIFEIHDIDITNPREYKKYGLEI